MQARGCLLEHDGDSFVFNLMFMRKTILRLKTNDCFRPIKARVEKYLKTNYNPSYHSMLLEEKSVSQTPYHHRSGFSWLAQLLVLTLKEHIRRLAGSP